MSSNYSDGRDVPLREFMSLLLGSKWLIGTALAIGLLAAAAHILLSKPVYEATARVAVDARGRQGSVPFADPNSAALANKVTNELETLISNSMAEGVAEALLKRKYIDSLSDTPIQILQSVGVEDSLVPDMQMRQIILRLSKSVDFSPVRESDIIRISARSSDPREAALIANTYTGVYVDRNLDITREKSKSVREFLESQVDVRKGALDSAEQSLRGYMQSSGVVSLDGETNRTVEQLAQLEATRDALGVDIKTRTQTLNSFKQELEKQEPDIARAMGQSNDTYIRMLQDQLARLEVQRDLYLSQAQTSSSDDVTSGQLKEVNAQIASLRANLQARTAAYLKTISPGDRNAGQSEAGVNFLSQVKQRIIEQQIELDGLVAKKISLNSVIKEYERKFNQIPRKSLAFAKLQRGRLSNERLFLMVEEKFNEAAINERSQYGSVSVIDRAVVPLRPASPRPVLDMLVGLLAGLVVGVGIVLTRAALDVFVRVPEDLKRRGLTPLGVISRMTTANGNGEDRSKAAGGSVLTPNLVAHLQSFSPISESYRHLYTNVKYLRPDKPLKNFLVASPNPGEGKTTTACNLAIVAAEVERRVLLVDADLRRPTVHSSFGLPKAPGLVELFARKATMPEVLHMNVLDHLDVVCCGTMPHNPSAVLGGDSIRQFIADMAGTYDVVIFDSPPLFAVADSLLLGRRVDGVILVVSAGKTKVGAVERAVESLSEVGGKVLGVVLNGFDPRRAQRGYHENEGYGYTSYDYYHTPSNGEGKRSGSHHHTSSKAKKE